MLKSIDLFPAPVGVRINQGETYTTKCGGIMSILTIITMILVSLGAVLAFILDTAEFNENTEIENLTYDNDQIYELHDTEAMIAFQFVWKDAEAEAQKRLEKSLVDQYIRYFFVDTNKRGGTTTLEVYPAVLCKDKYSSADYD